MTEGKRCSVVDAIGDQRAKRDHEAASPPNIVVLQADQLAADALGAYGNQVVSAPHIDQLAQSGAVFDRAYCNSPLCAPSRASMMTGLLPSQNGCYDNGADFPSSVPTFAHHLRALGYHTALVGRMHFIGPDQHHGFEERLTTDVYPADLDMVPDWNLDSSQRLPWYHEADSVFAAGACKATVQQDFDDEVGFLALRHLNDRARVDRALGRRNPFLMVASFIHPHDPYEPPPEHWDRYDNVEIDGPTHPDPPTADSDPHTHRLRAMSGFDARQPNAAQILRARRAYYAAVAYIDDHVGRIRARLHELGMAENTVVILTSDHGDMRGEKGLWYKMSPYEQSARVPLIVVGPEDRVPRGRFATPVSLLDLAPTLVKLAGGDDPGPSLLDIARREGAGTSAADRDIVIEYLAEGTVAPHVTVVRGQYKFVRCPGDPDQLFDLDTDPDELVNVAGHPEHTRRVALLRKDLDDRYDFAALEEQVRVSQRRRQLVSRALATGSVRHWDFDPAPEQRYVRGDFWSSLERGRIPDLGS
ncbi:choline-sulfatase [Leekyejoonella antrihumi]|uniref:Choline-sulfatase n=1 Tax=Leekyejoonella antrihumi TaxID=1660198 RepID=A0A563E3B0_9MICO|nr:choline-sulfatase [Leekyejoonella antrihumi]TWP37008.1 choline-sulfatase [Leekyejoonella antrihumi]